MSKAQSKKNASSTSSVSGTPFTDFIKRLYADADGCEELFRDVLAVFQKFSPNLTKEHVQIFLRGASCNCACCIDEELALEAGPRGSKRSKQPRHQHCCCGVTPGSGPITYRAWPMNSFPSF